MPRSMSLIAIAAIAAMAVSLVNLTNVARAEYPEKPIVVTVNVGPGGSTGAAARILAKAMEKTLGQPLVIVHKPGGGGTKGALLVMKENPDGYNIGYSFSQNLTFAPQYKRKTPLFTVGNFDFLGSVADPRMSLVSLSGRGWTDMKGMIAKLKAEGKPLRIVYGGGAGGLLGTAIKRDLGIDTKVIRVRGGGKSMQRVLGGHVDVVFTGGAHTPYTQAGKTIVVASVGEERNPDYPGAPTLKELGSEMSATTLQVFYAPKGLPKAVKDKLSDAITQASSDPKIVNLFQKNFKMRILNLRGDALTKYLVAEEKRYAKLIASYDR